MSEASSSLLKEKMVVALTSHLRKQCGYRVGLVHILSEAPLILYPEARLIPFSCIIIQNRGQET